MVAGGRRDAVFESRQSPIRPHPFDPHGPLFEESILLRAGTIIRNDMRGLCRKMIDYLLLRDLEGASRNVPATRDERKCTCEASSERLRDPMNDGRREVDRRTRATARREPRQENNTNDST